jgi:hypothetical protein
MEMNFEFERKQRGDAGTIVISRSPIGDYLSSVGYLLLAMDHRQSAIGNSQSAISNP